VNQFEQKAVRRRMILPDVQAGAMAISLAQASAPSLKFGLTCNVSTGMSMSGRFSEHHQYLLCHIVCPNHQGLLLTDLLDNLCKPIRHTQKRAVAC
jgi:hypothetical protein